MLQIAILIIIDPSCNQLQLPHIHNNGAKIAFGLRAKSIHSAAPLSGQRDEEHTWSITIETRPAVQSNVSPGERKYHMSQQPYLGSYFLHTTQTTRHFKPAALVLRHPTRRVETCTPLCTQPAHCGCGAARRVKAHVKRAERPQMHVHYSAGIWP
jgi:hypothetical protein